MPDQAPKPTHHLQRPRIGISMGDPAGIGAECIVKALAAPTPAARARRARADFVIYGHAPTLHAAADQLQIDPFWWQVKRTATHNAHLQGQPVLLIDGTPEALNLSSDDLDAAALNHTHNKHAGAASYAWVEDAIADALAAINTKPAGGTHTGQLTFGTGLHTHAIVTLPISKAAWALAGIKRFPGHTEILAERTAAKRARMAFILDELRALLVTSHIPLADVPSAITIGKVKDSIDLAHETALRLGIDNPTVAVAGINPHAGEEGLLGDDEQRVINPAISLAQSQGINVIGPLPGDTVFLEALRGNADIVVAMFHDQALAPIKTLGFDRAVNYTAGLPIIRTSPDHGTAFNIAGKNKANPGSTEAAIDLAINMATHQLAADAQTATEHAS